MSKVSQFQEEREQLNQLVLTHENLTVKRFYNLDTKAYSDGALPRKVKELLGLVASFVLRCDDCITYHLIQCHQQGVSDEELVEALAIGLVVGGSITIPHQRRAMEMWDELNRQDEREGK